MIYFYFIWGRKFYDEQSDAMAMSELLVLCPHYLPWDLHNFNHLHKLMVIWSPSKLSFYSCEFIEPYNRTGIFVCIHLILLGTVRKYFSLKMLYFFCQFNIFIFFLPPELLATKPVSVVCLIPSYIVTLNPPWKAITNKLI